MTPQFWHAIANWVAPFKRKLAFGAGIGLVATAAFFSTAWSHQQPNKWLFLCLWFSALLLFWCFGLLLVSRLYGTLPVKSAVVGLNYHWNAVAGWYGALFLAVWFLGLAFATIVAPLKMLIAFAR